MNCDASQIIRSITFNGNMTTVPIFIIAVILSLSLLHSWTYGMTNTFNVSVPLLNLAYASSKPFNSHDVQLQGEIHLRNLLNIANARNVQSELQAHRLGTLHGFQSLQNIKLRTAFLKTIGNTPIITQQLRVPLSVPSLFPFELPIGPQNTTQAEAAASGGNVPSPNQSTAAPMATTTATTTSTSTSLGFAGLSEGQIGGYFYPPDVQVAVGPNYVVEMNNLEGKTFTKTGGYVSIFSLYPFFRISGSDEISDPRIMYDTGSGKWFASIADLTLNTVKVAVSTSSTPTTFRIFSFKFSNCPDYPSIGLNDDKFAMSANLFTLNCNGNYAGVQYYILNKSYLTGGTTTLVYSRSLPNTSIFSLEPVQTLSSSTTLFMVTVGDDLSNRATVYSFSNPPSSSNAPTGVVNYSIHTTHIPPNAIQRGTSNQVDTGDARILDASWYGGRLWLTFGDACTPSGDVQTRSCVRLTQINTSTSSLSQDLDIGAKGAYYFYPALRMDTSSNLLVVFGASSLGIYPSIFATGQDTAGTLFDSTPLTIKIGTYPELTSRFGDYFGAAVDPSNPSMVWGAGEFHSSYFWSTFISAMVRK